ncbi:MAG: glycoside hydrolase family 2 [Clostridia bacterium]|nr:glycoside hydrolase family 2 [Clostridia bacterium]
MEKLLTPFGEKIDKNCPLSEYPRPQLVRDSYQCLNGVWRYAIAKKNELIKEYQGKILVPFSPECILSGVEKIVTPEDILYYQRDFEYKKENDRTILHFGAVDYSCIVKINGKTVGTHTGGFFAFSFDITDFLVEGNNSLEVIVTDPSDTGTQARGKQSSKRGGIWYTPQSGIWQPVWIEQVPNNYIKGIKITPDIDKEIVMIDVDFNNDVEEVTATVKDSNGENITTYSTKTNHLEISMKGATLWSPENPYLYGLEISCLSETIQSYFGMRKFSIGKDENGVSRMMLNNKPYFNNGLLDQGYWSDGMLTPPSDEAMIYDIQTMKDMGFNMLRKHIKIEPLRWYYHCDRIGMLVWQDMINGGGIYGSNPIMVKPALNLAFNTKRFFASDGESHYKYFSRDDENGRKEYYIDSERLINQLYNTVSLSLYVPFNEGWGQFDAVKACDFYRNLDPTRIIDHASGWHDQGYGDVNSFHIYFTPFFFPKFDENDERPIALTEFGGYSLKVDGHMFNTDKFFGYRKYYDKEKYAEAIEKLFTKLAKLIHTKGLSATVYTEVSDVEDECNGLLTYDRKVLKIDKEFMKKLNSKLVI